jgi:hypothetical protein
MLGALLAVCAGCLVTSKYEIPDPTNVPPSIQDDPDGIAKISDTLWLDSENAQSWEFSVLVRDEDTEQVLDARWRLVKQNEPLPAFNRLLDPLPAGMLVRRLRFVVGSTQLSDGECHKLELAVSGHFFKNRMGMDRTEPFLFAEVTDGFEDDLAMAAWWIWEGKGNNQTTDVDVGRLGKSCNADESLLGNPSPVEAQQ